MSPVVSGLMTLLLIIVFLGIVVWAYSKRNRAKFEYMAQLPLEDDANASVPVAKKEVPSE